jgi:hypothetical protein
MAFGLPCAGHEWAAVLAFDSFKHLAAEAVKYYAVTRRRHWWQLCQRWREGLHTAWQCIKLLSATLLQFPVLGPVQ